ncbi:MAG: PD40 domain-containing protein [Polyangiaceae bacterium]|nr:PD40 domain-containing protein [Polyangiaceae bacterium]
MLLVALCLGAAVPALATTAAAQDPPASGEDVLGTLVVAPGLSGTGERIYPKIGVVPSLDAALEDVTLRAVVRRDLDLCGEFEVIADDQAPDGMYLSDTPVDVEAWKKKGAEAVVKVHGRRLPSGQVELRSVAFFTDQGDAPVYDHAVTVEAADPAALRAASHRAADELIGALTGTPGGFASQMTFVYGGGKARRAYVMDADGHEPRAVTDYDRVVLAPAFGPAQQLYYAASIDNGRYKIYGAGSPAPIPLSQRGSVYGLAFSEARDQVAVSIAVGSDIKLFAGPDLANLTPATDVSYALHPAFTPSGKLSFSGEGPGGAQRIHVDGKPISPVGLNASAPVWCRHPDGVRVVYGVDSGAGQDLVASAENGSGLVRLTGGQGSNNYAACSPDGRLVAFFSTRRGGEGPGLYIMRIDGGRPKRVSTLVGDSLRWARLPQAAPAPAPAPASGEPLYPP